MLQDVINTAKEKMKKSCEVYEREMMSLRAGRERRPPLTRSATSPLRNPGCW